jgi:putative polyhydroxyalkanoate system protein
VVDLLAIAEMELQVGHWVQSLANPLPPLAARWPRRYAGRPSPTARAMARIDIQHPHTRDDAEARTIVDGIAAQLRERYGISGSWEGDAVRLSGAGLEGQVELLPRQVRVTAELGFLLSALRGQVEAEIRRVLVERLD